MQFLQDFSFTYFILLSLCYLITFYIFIINPRFPSLNTMVGFFYFLTLFAFFIIIIESFTYLLDGSSTYELVNGSVRLLLMPTFAIVLFILIRNASDLNIIKKIYIFFIILAAISIFYQVIYGKLSFVANPYGALRFGLPGFASITGAVNTYPGAFYSAVILLFFSSYKNEFIKVALILLMCGAAIFTMSKSGLLNVILLLLILTIAGIFFKKWRFLLYLYLISIIILLISNQILNATVIAVVNTFGIELLNSTKSSATEWQPLIPRITDRIFGVFLSSDMPTILEFLFGTGLKGGSGTTGFYAPTTHNSFLDVYVMGGITSLIILVGLYLSVQITLLWKFYLSSDLFDLALFTSNLLMLINGLVHNGVLFHPAMSFTFWISVAYIFIYYDKLES